MALAHNADYLRIGADRELQQALQACWQRDQVHDAGSDSAAWLAGQFPHLVAQVNRVQHFQPDWVPLLDAAHEANEQGRKPSLVGPLTYLWFAQADAGTDKLDLLERLLPAYGEIFGRLAARGIEWVQIDEPILTLDLPLEWRNAFERAYHILQYSPLKKLVATYSGDLKDNLGVAALLPVAGLHIDSVSVTEQLGPVFDRLPTYKVLSLGNASDQTELVQEARARFGENLLLAGAA
ncbi:5-methyltetrahydropteroyltriglutamate--homocysteine methyltransferase [Pseudomonas floridensis]|uniref:5-methyltetrahydropteroyltriglutamate--homocysteine methyltransferase n=1 Tax=Pseudomonas floridensis TaxID=1958950 RepID=A0A1X0NC23_9PSED|nr:5-methyltetrahydropteroyltriglutamate--homocysteine methyltransferase [Pseudomonas floridensis]ORC61827.1 5-methyltetrahydropteroyltriglutamate--homocysteine methyltransferase [Pseudomonas floridensis]